MGNYVLKYASKPGNSSLRGLVFDNISLVAGDEQKERLGHHLRNLDANNAYYIDVTRNRGVGGEHSYFKKKTVGHNSRLKKIFKRIFEGGKAERLLTYHADINVYRS